MIFVERHVVIEQLCSKFGWFYNDNFSDFFFLQWEDQICKWSFKVYHVTVKHISYNPRPLSTQSQAKRGDWMEASPLSMINSEKSTRIFTRFQVFYAQARKIAVLLYFKLCLSGCEFRALGATQESGKIWKMESHFRISI